MDFMARYGTRLVDAGFHILPLAPGQKYPGAYRLGEWGKMYGWDKYADREPSSLELHHWSQWPGAGIGIVGGKVVAIDIDISDAGLSLEIDHICRDHLGDTQAIRIGQPPKRLLVYRTREVFNSGSYGPLEVLCLGRQFVAYGIHPKTGRPYEWPEEGLADLDILDLPVVSQEDVTAFVQVAVKLLPAQKRPPFRHAVAGQHVGQMPIAGPGHRSSRGTIEGVGAAMPHIDNPDLPYDEWIRVGLALKGALEEDGWSIFDAWSRLSVKYDARATIRAWNSMQPHSIGAGTIYHLARLSGWRPDPAIQLNGDFDDRKHRLLTLISAKDESYD